MAGDRILEQYVLDFRATADVVDDERRARLRLRLRDDTDVWEGPRKHPRDEIAWTIRAWIA